MAEGQNQPLDVVSPVVFFDPRRGDDQQRDDLAPGAAGTGGCSGG